MTQTFRIAAIPGDGIGKEVMPEGVRVLEAARRAGSRNTLRSVNAADISDTTGSPLRSGISTSPIARRPRQIGLIIGWSGLAVESAELRLVPRSTVGLDEDGAFRSRVNPAMLDQLEELTDADADDVAAADQRDAHAPVRAGHTILRQGRRGVRGG